MQSKCGNKPVHKVISQQNLLYLYIDTIINKPDKLFIIFNLKKYLLLLFSIDYYMLF